MTLDAYREDRGTSDCCCCPCVPKDASEEGAGCCTWYPQLQTLNERYYVPLLRNRFVKAIVLVSFFTFTGIAGWQVKSPSAPPLCEAKLTPQLVFLPLRSPSPPPPPHPSPLIGAGV